MASVATYTDQDKSSDNSFASVCSEPLGLTDDLKPHFKRYCDLRKERRFLSLRETELSEEIHILKPTDFKNSIMGKLRNWVERQQLNSLVEAQDANSTRRSVCERELRELKKQVASSSGKEILRKFNNLSQAKVRAYMEPKLRTYEHRVEEMRAQHLQRMSFKVDGVVVNLSKRRLSIFEQSVLNHGLEMSWPQNIDRKVVRIESEALFSRLRHCEKLPHRIKTIIRSTMKNAMRNWSLSFYPKQLKGLETLKKLASDNELQFCSTAKPSNKLVIMDRIAYVEKMKACLETQSTFFRRLGPSIRTDSEGHRKSPLIEQEESFNLQLEKMRYENMITRAMFYRFRCKGAIPPRLVGLPAIHKNPKHPPLELQVLMDESYLGPLSSWLCDQLQILFPKVGFVTDSMETLENLLRANLQTSYRACGRRRPVAVFLEPQNIKLTLPLSLVQRHIHTLANKSKNLCIGTGALKRLIRLCCEKIICLFDDNVYRLEEEGVPFDNHLADVLVNLALDMVDSHWREASKMSLPEESRPLVFMRAQSGTAFAIFRSKTHAETFLSLCNRVSPHLQQVIEIFRDDQLVFNDLFIDLRPLPEAPPRTRWPAQGISDVERLRIPSTSFIPYEEKLQDLEKCFARCHQLCSDKERKESTQLLREIFKVNGYCSSDIDRASKCSTGLAPEKTTSDDLEVVPWRLPYNPLLHSSLCRAVDNINHFLVRTRVELQPVYTRTRSILAPMESVPDDFKGQIVFSLHCLNCDALTFHSSDRHLMSVVTSRKSHHRCLDNMSKDQGPQGEEQRPPPQFIVHIAMRTPHHKIARTVWENETNKSHHQKDRGTILRLLPK